MLLRSPLCSLGMWGGVRELLTCSEAVHMGVAGSMLLNSLGSQLWKGWISGVSHMPPTACAEAFLSEWLHFFRSKRGGVIRGHRIEPELIALMNEDCKELLVCLCTPQGHSEKVHVCKSGRA